MVFPVIDLRSDTVTCPSPPMREAMARAPVGDDVYGEDPSVNLLQERVAAVVGKEAALFMPSGTMSNQVAIKTLCRGTEAVCEANAHVFHYEMAAAAGRSGIQLYPVPGKRGVLTWAEIEPAIRPDAGYLPRTGLICLENTHNRGGGAITPLPVVAEIGREARARNIPVHMDGARLWNAAVETGTPLAAYAERCDSVSVCFSKGLGAPVGSCLCGTADFINEANRIRRSFGGGMRQAGILAAAALYALDNNVGRLANDHRRAREFAAGAAAIPGLRVEKPQTNIVMVDVADADISPKAVEAALRAEGVLISAIGPRRLRAVTHLDVDDAGIARALEVLAAVMAKWTKS